MKAIVGRKVWLVVRVENGKEDPTYGGEWEDTRRAAQETANEHNRFLVLAGERYVVRKAVLS